MFAESISAQARQEAIALFLPSVQLYLSHMPSTSQSSSLEGTNEIAHLFRDALLAYLSTSHKAGKLQMTKAQLQTRGCTVQTGSLTVKFQTFSHYCFFQSQWRNGSIQFKCAHERLYAGGLSEEASSSLAMGVGSALTQSLRVCPLEDAMIEKHLKKLLVDSIWSCQTLPAALKSCNRAQTAAFLLQNLPEGLVIGLRVQLRDIILSPHADDVGKLLS